jgi:hypothetical protein
MPEEISDKEAIEKAKQFLEKEGCTVIDVLENSKSGDAYLVKASVKKDLLLNFVAIVRVDANTGDCSLTRFSKQGF